MKKHIMALPLLSLCLLLSACGGNIQRLAPGAPEIKVDRGEYLEQKNAGKDSVDISSVIAFVETMNDTLPPSEQITDYTTSYDEEEHTVYVHSEQGDLAFRLSDDGEIQFVSSSGTPEQKATMSHSIATVYIGLGEANDVESLFSKVEETRWLNNINCKAVEKNIDSFSFSDLDLSLLDANIPELEGADEIEGTISQGLTMPVLTEQLEEAGLDDLTDYFESPSLGKYWTDIDTDDIQDDIAKVEQNGTSLRDLFHSYQLEAPEEVELDTSWKEDDMDLSMDTPELPDSFGDGTSTDLSDSANDKMTEFQEKLNGFKTEADSIFD